MATPRFSVSEFRTHLDSDPCPAIIVEGPRDQQRYKMLLDELVPQIRPLILSVQSIDVPVEFCAVGGHELGDRGRVLALATHSELKSYHEQLKFVIDSDFDYINKSLQFPSGVLATDFPAYESYFAKEEAVGLFLRRIRNRDGFSWDRHAADVLRISRETFVLRMAARNVNGYRGWPEKWIKRDVDAGLEGLRINRESCMKRACGGRDDVAQEILSRADELDKAVPKGDGVVHGHDFTELLALSCVQATGQKDFANAEVAFASLRGSTGSDILRNSSLVKSLVDHCLSTPPPQVPHGRADD